MSYFGWVGHYFGWVRASGGVWYIILSGWGWMGHYFGWVGVSGKIVWLGRVGALFDNSLPECFFKNPNVLLRIRMFLISRLHK